LALAIPEAFIFLEFSIPRMGKRADAIVIVDGIVFVIEYKVGASGYTEHAVEQVLDYAVDLKNFHAGSHNRRIIPIVVATNAPECPIKIEFWPDDIAKPILTNRHAFIPTIRHVIADCSASAFDAISWADSPYKPTPTIIEAAKALYRGHDGREISRSEAGTENLTATAVTINSIVDRAKENGRKAICFVTGVPGSGKTLAGLNIASSRMNAHQDENAVFLSGNGPLVDVLREALADDQVARQKEGDGPSISKRDALRKSSVFIQNIHHFRDDSLDTTLPPDERVVVFDEAQRAWSREQTSRFMREKRGKLEFNQSEPEFLLSVMDRHQDWCVVVCLVGGGQEINTGEAGIDGWFSALRDHFPNWDVHVSDRLPLAQNYSFGGGSTAIESSALHLSVSIRSFRAELVSDFVSAVVDGNTSGARAFADRLDQYPIVLTRDLTIARRWLRAQSRGSERIGLVASSNALRLKPVGIYVKSLIDPPVWFLAGRQDVRSSFALEDVATEFDIQGLELDWVGLVWDANLRWIGDRWQHCSFRGTRWEEVRDSTRLSFLSNAYRVLMTRARQGMVIVVPEGDDADITRKREYYDRTFLFLRECGFKLLE